MLPKDRISGRIMFALAFFAILAYLPTLAQPLLEDDYPNITLAVHLGRPAGFHEMTETVFRLRATSLWLMNAAYHWFGMHPAPYYCIGMALHVANVWLVYALGYWKALGYELAAWAAFFFAIYEGHQEAIMWFSACNELLMFLFGAASLLCWLRFLSEGRRRWVWYGGALFCFFAALISKESAVIFAALWLLPLIGDRARSKSPYLIPMLALTLLALWSTYSLRAGSFRFQDGSFSLDAPFWKILPLNLVRLFWFWGFAALAAAAVWRWSPSRRAVYISLTWAATSLIPYSFLTYSTHIPSRQFYLASAGLAWIAGAGFLAVRERFSRSRQPVIAVLCAIMVAQNVGYLWTRKRRQFLARAQPTEELVLLAQHTAGPIYVKCFPRPRLIAEEAVHLRTGKPVSDIIWDESEARTRSASATFCYDRK